MRQSRDAPCCIARSRLHHDGTSSTHRTLFRTAQVSVRLPEIDINRDRVGPFRYRVASLEQIAAQRRCCERPTPCSVAGRTPGPPKEHDGQRDDHPSTSFVFLIVVSWPSVYSRSAGADVRKGTRRSGMDVPFYCEQRWQSERATLRPMDRVPSADPGAGDSHDSPRRLPAGRQPATTDGRRRNKGRHRSILVTGQTPGTAAGVLSRPTVPKSGDVLVSRPTARADAYAISVIPTHAHIIAVRYEDAVEIGRELARGLVVDGWYTCDHTHSVRIARHRR
jgi:hypothetical protein